MNTTIRLLLSVLGVAAGEGLRAGEPLPARTGKVLVLDNDRTLEGEIERAGDQYRVRRSLGVTSVPAERVVRLCDSKEDALAFLRQRTNLDDPDERLRLARWCHLQGLRAEALAEVRAAVALRPGHDESRRLLGYLRESQRAAAEAPKRPAAQTGAGKQAGRPPVELSAEATGLFASRVQPILMNACARCHVARAGEAFRLQRTHGAGTVNRRLTQLNLTAVLGQLNLREPELSPLLVKAVRAHGPEGEAPLKGRQAEAFQALEDWVKRAVANNPHLRKESGPAAAALPEGPPAPPARADVPIVPTPTPPEPDAPRPAGTTPAPAAGPGDEFDPSVFNRQMHPDRKPPP